MPFYEAGKGQSINCRRDAGIDTGVLKKSIDTGKKYGDVSIFLRLRYFYDEYQKA
jgi:hypothetical protein